MFKQGPPYLFLVFWSITLQLFFYPIVAISQQDELLKIINSQQPQDSIEAHLTLFFNKYKSRLNNNDLADCYHDVASKWYYENWWNDGNDTDLDKAITFTEKALTLKKQIDELPIGSLEKTAYNLGAFYHIKGEVFKAEEAFLYLVNNGQDVSKIENAKVELGTIYLETGDFYKALEQFDQIIISNSEKEISENLIDAHIIKAEIFSIMGIAQFSNQISANLNTADSLLSSSGIEDSYYYNRIYQTEGNRLIELGKYEKALEYHKKVLSDSLALYPNELARVYNSLGFSEVKLNHYDIGEIYLNKSTSYDPNYSLPYENLGDLYLAKKDFKRAMNNYQKAIFWLIDKSPPIDITILPLIKDIEVVPDKIYLLNHLITKTNGWLSYYEEESNEDFLQYALETVRLSDQLIDLIRNESSENRSKYFWREKGASLYSKAVEVCYMLNLTEEAYYFMERNKALLLLEDISEEQAKELAQIPQELSQREFLLKKDIFLFENQLQNETDAALKDSLKKIVYDVKQGYHLFADSLKKAYPEYENLKRQIQILPFESFKSKYVKENQTVLQYILNKNQGYGLLNSHESTAFFKIENPQQLEKELIDLYGQMTDLEVSRPKMERYKNSSHKLFTKLIPPSVFEELVDKKVIIVTDYLLQQIPFEAFVSDIDTSRYLIEDSEISYAYSISYLDAKQQVENKPTHDFLGLAPVEFKNLGLQKLHFSPLEIDAAHAHFKGDTYLNDSATKNIFLENLPDYKVIHLSTHADVGNDGNPWIAFSDKKVYLNELYATTTEAQMVVLSACNTSIGELRKGEGAMSLARGFFHAGAKSVISSLWSTNDKSSKEIMARFYENLDQGFSQSKALREAKLDYLHANKDANFGPGYWAALIVIGDNAPLVQSTNKWWLYGGLLFALSITLAGFIVVRKQRKH
ncbi:CHAT domain-containing protein [Euzebyella saccharophila]|uniref:CHAT domain-containing protein n=1 Tax=Euzebyella saccharophila TaxID=679664 RepID=A0ABV8JT18_9FLAO